MTKQIRTLRTVKAISNQSLTIDLGVAFTGGLTAWMKTKASSTHYREFQIVDNRYLFLPKSSTVDITDPTSGEVFLIDGKWKFDVRQILSGASSDTVQTIYTGTIFFTPNITDS